MHAGYFAGEVGVVVGIARHVFGELGGFAVEGLLGVGSGLGRGP